MPTRLVSGSITGKKCRLRVGCSAVIFSNDRQKVLLTRRSDNGLWCLPGGAMDPGESAEQTCVREVQEETGLSVRVLRLIGVYSSPEWLIEYPDGYRVQLVAMCFETEVTDGKLTASNETDQFGYFTLQEAQGLEMMQNHQQRIEDAFIGQREAFIR
jgi:8-oxo-dGTP pyrophosphatase MutT (NUDIX family)